METTIEQVIKNIKNYMEWTQEMENDDNDFFKSGWEKGAINAYTNCLRMCEGLKESQEEIGQEEAMSQGMPY